MSSTVDRIQQSLYHVEKGNKKFLLPWLIKNLNPPVQNALVFSRTKHGADKIAETSPSRASRRRPSTATRARPPA